MKEDIVYIVDTWSASYIAATICITIASLTSILLYFALSDLLCCFKRRQVDRDAGNDVENKNRSNEASGGTTSLESSNSSVSPPEDIDHVSATEVTGTQNAGTNRKFEKKNSLIGKKESNSETNSDPEASGHLKDRITMFEASSAPNTQNMRLKDGTKPKKKKPNSQAFQEFESRGILIGFGNVPKKRVAPSDDTDETTKAEGGEQIMEHVVSGSNPQLSSTPPKSRTPENENNSNTNSLSRLTDDEGIHTMDEEDEFAAVPRNVEVLKSFRRPPPPKNRSKARRSMRSRIHKDDNMNVPGFDFSMDELEEPLEDSEYSTAGTTPSHSTDSIMTPSDQATPDNSSSHDGSPIRDAHDGSPIRDTHDGSPISDTHDGSPIRDVRKFSPEKDKYYANSKRDTHVDTSRKLVNPASQQNDNVVKRSRFSRFSVDNEAHSSPAVLNRFSLNRSVSSPGHAMAASKHEGDDGKIVLVVDDSKSANEQSRARINSIREVEEVSFNDFMGLIHRSNSKSGYSPVILNDPAMRNRILSGTDNEGATSRVGVSSTPSGFQNAPVASPREGPNSGNGRTALTRPRSFHPTNFTRPRDMFARASVAGNFSLSEASPSGNRLSSVTTSTPERDVKVTEAPGSSRSASHGSPKHLRKWDSEHSGLGSKRKAVEGEESKSEDEQSVESKTKVFQETAL